ncbi:MAG: transporter substrate-binding domain-containing protein [Bacillota bacterium]
MKKLFLAITAVFTIALLSACGLAEDDTLRVGMDLSYPPFETEEDGDPEGISVDVAHELGDYLGRDVEIVDTGFGQLIPSLNSGEIDIVIGSMSITEEREQSVDFTDPYFYFKIISLVNKEFADDQDITEDTSKDDLLDIEDARYVGIADQVSYQIPQDMGLDTVEATDLSSAVYEVVQGERDILMMSAFPVVNNHSSNEEDTMVVWDPFMVSPIGMAVREGDEELLDEANAFIAQMDEEDGVYDRLREDWDEEIESRLGRYGLDFFIYED